MFYLYDESQALVHFDWVYPIQMLRNAFGLWCRGSTDLPGSQAV